MDQIKYLIYPFLIFIFLALGFIICSSFPPARISESQINSIEQNTVASPLSPGKTMFQQNCQSCHGLDKKLVGPSLRGFTDRGPWNKRDNIYKWIHNPAEFMATNAYAKALKEEYGQIMPPFPQLSEKDIDGIIEYISNSSTPMAVSMQ